MQDEDYKLGDVGSLAKKIPSSEWPFWKKILIFLTIGVILIIVFILIIVLISGKKNANEEENKLIDESKVFGDIICLYEKNKIQTQILGFDFVKPNSFDIAINNKKVNFNREVKFPEDINEVRFVFYEKTANIDNMFKGVKSLVSVEIN